MRTAFLDGGAVEVWRNRASVMENGGPARGTPCKETRAKEVGGNILDGCEQSQQGPLRTPPAPFRPPNGPPAHCGGSRCVQQFVGIHRRGNWGIAAVLPGSKRSQIRGLLPAGRAPHGHAQRRVRMRRRCIPLRLWPSLLRLRAVLAVRIVSAHG